MIDFTTQWDTNDPAGDHWVDVKIQRNGSTIKNFDNALHAVQDRGTLSITWADMSPPTGNNTYRIRAEASFDNRFFFKERSLRLFGAKK